MSQAVYCGLSLHQQRTAERYVDACAWKRGTHVYRQDDYRRDEFGHDGSPAQMSSLLYTILLIEAPTVRR